MPKKKIVFDYDGMLFKACCAVESKSIIVKHKTGFQRDFKTRTEFYGHYKKKSGGWLALNPNYKLDDFEIEDVKEVEPLEHALSTLKKNIQAVIDNLEADEYYGYMSGQGNFRKDICTLLPYKGNRVGLEPPVHLAEAKAYLRKHHCAVYSAGNEPDDLLTTDMYSAIKAKENLVGVVYEKDYMGCDGTWYYPDSGKLIEVSGFGELTRTDAGIKGKGRIWKYYQACSQDTSDNYKAHCFSDQGNGDVTAYLALKECSNDKEAFEAMVKHFKYLYPEPKVITNWKDDTFEIDWLYVMQEMFNMCHLERWKGDRIDVKQVLNRLKVNYGNT